MSTCLVACLFLVCFSNSVGFLNRSTYFDFDFDYRAARCMGARERGRVAASSPVVLCPVPVAPVRVTLRDCTFFCAGFISALAFIWWLIFGVVHVD